MSGPTWRELERGTQLVADLATSGLQEGERESVMLEGVCDLIGARIGLVFRGHVVPGDQPLRMISVHQHGMDEAEQGVLATYVAENGQDDPMVKPCMAVEPGRSKALLRQELMTDAAFHRHPHFDLCREVDIDSRIMVTLRMPGTRVLNLTLHRAIGERAFDERHRKLLSSVGPAMLQLMEWPGMPLGGLLREPDGSILDLRAVSPQGVAATLGFTPRELEVARHVCRGLSNKEAAAELGISPETVKRHVSHLLQKARASSRAELAYVLRQLV